MFSYIIFCFHEKAIYQISGVGGHRTLKEQLNHVFAPGSFFSTLAEVLCLYLLMLILEGTVQIILVPAVLAFLYHGSFW